MCGGGQEEYGGYGGCGDGLREGSHAFVFMCMVIYCFYVFRCNGWIGECVEEEGRKEKGKNLAVHLDISFINNHYNIKMSKCQCQLKLTF